MISGIGVISTVTILTTSSFRLECVAKALGRRDGTQWHPRSIERSMVCQPMAAHEEASVYEEAISFINEIDEKAMRFIQVQANVCLISQWR